MERIRLISQGTNLVSSLLGVLRETPQSGVSGRARKLSARDGGTRNPLRSATLTVAALAAVSLLAGCATCGLGGACGGVVAEEPAEVIAAPEPVEPTPVQPPPPPPKPVVPPDDRTIYFDYDQSTVSMSGAALLRQHASYLQKADDKTVTVEGHCDERGSKSYNLALGERRGQAVRDLLVSAGVARSRISVVSYGEESPASAGNNEAAWAKNRRAFIRYD